MKNLNLYILKLKLKFIEIAIKAAVNFNDKLCEHVLKQQFSKQRSENDVKYSMRKKQISSERHEQNNNNNQKLYS